MEQPVKDKAPKPQGLMPKNLQAMVIAGLAFLMIAVMALTARKPPQPVAAAVATTPTPPPVDEAKILAFRNSLQKQQNDSDADLERALLRRQALLAGADTPPGANPYQPGTYPPGTYPPGTPPDQVKEDEKRRRYRFLRHPGYLAMLIAMPASAMAIGSWLALIPAAGFGIVILRRARKEDDFLKENLSGYIDYTERVRGGVFLRLSAIGAATAVLVGLTLAVAGFLYAASTNSTAGLILSPSPFNEQRAFQDLKQFTELGPRPPGSDVHDWADLLIHLGFLGAGVNVHNVSFDTFEASTPVGKIQMANVIARIPGAQPDIIILGGHYDTKRMRMRFVGANDGGSSTAFLIEMAQVLAQRRNRFTYWVVLFDGEEALKSWSAADGLYGSRRFAQILTKDQVKQIRAMINVDMIGDRNLHIHRDTHSDPQLSNLIFREGQELGYGRYFLEKAFPVEDDHLPFVRAGIPAVDLISLDYGPLNLYSHTPLDTVGKCSASSLGIVGRVLLRALDELETGRMAQIASR